VNHEGRSPTPAYGVHASACQSAVVLRSKLEHHPMTQPLDTTHSFAHRPVFMVQKLLRMVPGRTIVARVGRSLVLLLIALMGGNAFGAEDTNNLPAPIEFQPWKIRVVFFTPSDLHVPSGAHERITKIAQYMEKFFFDGMKRWNYPPAAKTLFQWDADGKVQMLEVSGDEPVASHKYDKPNYAPYVIQKASKQYGIKNRGNIWWIFIYLGDPPARFAKWEGFGNAKDGGWSMVDYDSRSGEIRPDLSMVDGFNGIYFLKGTLHELGHAFGLPHTAPDPDLGLGNTLMGPSTVVYVKRKGANADKVYFDEACAAMLWKHPFFSGIGKDRLVKPSVTLAEYQPNFNASNGSVTISGKLVSDQPAHSVIVADDGGKPDDDYWYRSYVSRLSPDGTFQVTINKPLKGEGKYYILFCFENGAVTGDGKIAFGRETAIRKSYRFHNGKFEFEN